MLSPSKHAPSNGEGHERRTAARARRAAESAALHSARRVLAAEAAGLAAVSARLDERFVRAVDLLAACRGKVVVTGMGKSGIVGRKIAATLASTGTPAAFLHAAEAVHGDFGAVGRNDVMLVLSHSGETEEIVRLLPLIERLSLPMVAMTGHVDSTLGRAAAVALDASVPEEACPLGLAPTTSTTAALALGDALAVALLEQRGFTEDDFALLHPAGSLGRRLLKVEDLMHTGDALPLVRPEAPLTDTLLEMSGKRLGVTGVIDADGRLVGIITDGDLRRAFARATDVSRLRARDLMTAKPKTIEAAALAARALATMERHSITSLFIVAPDTGRPAGIIHLHDLLKAGVA
jgi:arabinose-5-phosphate isomerase